MDYSWLEKLKGTRNNCNRISFPLPLEVLKIFETSHLLSRHDFFSAIRRVFLVRIIYAIDWI
ncbi:hypothetical protein MCU_01228 [Bartonella elizabethae Re6043vi]|uniref:Uncharacterized protein n=2 Tax=Bartonella elizabethae TaxID=807 RepID=J1A4V2_BAREL|nr:hypothetical protein MCU_01228 [Bartonella elizabethae Re6043vi]EJF96748.1 hypothetical protein MEE_00289 [Bartonella elizabethae F9251 = ATCC 49927]VEJ39485.1 Uncharacterised protein [Bartonella elizabethae]